MRNLRILGLVALGGLLSACQSQQQPPSQPAQQPTQQSTQQSTQEGAYVDFVMEMMVESAKLSEGPNDATKAIQAIESWRGADEDDGAD